MIIQNDLLQHGPSTLLYSRAPLSRDCRLPWCFPEIAGCLGSCFRRMLHPPGLQSHCRILAPGLTERIYLQYERRKLNNVKSFLHKTYSIESYDFIESKILKIKQKLG